MSIAKWHPAAEAFPLMRGEELTKFVEDIRVNGVRKPIEVYDGETFPEFKGFGLDGRNRLAACQILNIEPPIQFLTDMEVGSSITSYVVSLNVARRHLSSSQAAIVGVEIKKQFEQEAKARQRAAGGDHRSDGYREQAKPLVELIPQAVLAPGADDNKSRQLAAAIVGSNGRYVSDAERILSVSPELGDLIRGGQVVIPQAMAALKQREAHPEVFADFTAGRIDFAEFRDLCFLEESDPENWTRFRAGQTTLQEAVSRARDQKAQARKANEANLTASEFVAVAANRVKQAIEELGEDVAIDKIAEKAGISRDMADKIIVGIDEDQQQEESDNDGDKQDGGPVGKKAVRGEEIGLAPDGTPLYLAKEGEPTDCLNRPLGSDLVPIFFDLNEYRALIDELGQLRSRVREFKARRSAAWFDAKTTAAHIESAQNQLRNAAPYCVCPSCGGRGHAQSDGDKRCPTCESNAFVCEGNFRGLSKELQDIANGYH